MADGSQFRLVRCPKCHNLLPENPNYAVYQCGACGAVLKAKKKTSLTDGFVEKSDEEIRSWNNEKFEYLSEKGNSSIGSTSDLVMESSGVEQGSRKGIVFGYRTIDFPINSSGLENRNESVEEMKGFRLDPSGPRKDMRYMNEDDNLSNRRVNDWVNRYNLRDSENVNIEKDVGGFSTPSPGHNSMGTFRPGENMERSGNPRFSGKSWVGVGVDQGRNPYYGYPDEGSSSNGYGDNRWNNVPPIKPNSVPSLEQDPVEIMRTIDELKDQLSRYCGVVDKPRFNNDRPFPDPYYDNMPVSRPPQNRDNFYPPRRDVAAYEDQFPVQMNTKPFDQSTYPYQTGSSYIPPPIPQSPFNPRNPQTTNLNWNSSPLTFGTHNSGPHGRDPTPFQDLRPRERWLSDPESDIDSLSEPRRTVVRHKNGQYFRSVAGGAPFIACYNCFEFLKLPRNLIKGKNKVKCGACSSIIGLEIEKKRIIIRSSKESNSLSSELDDDSKCLRSNDSVASGNKSDQNLKKSDKNSVLEDRESKLILSEKKPSLSSSSVSSEREESPSHLTVQQNTPNSARPSSSSTKDALSLVEQSDYSSEHEAVQSNRVISVNDEIRSSQTSMEEVSEYEVIRSNRAINVSDKVRSSQTSMEDVSDYEVVQSNRALNGKNKIQSSQTSVEDVSEYEVIRSNRAINVSDKIRSSQTSMEDVSDYEVVQSNRAVNGKNKIHSSQTSVEDVSESSELEDSFEGYPITGTSQDSIEIEEEEDQSKNSSGEEIILADRVKKPNVLVNGHPIPDHLVKKAEKMAGTILPGDYWYDYQAGFWGVIGYPCLGIVPPFIEEFNYPMPTNCAAGDTRVYVNGRELHQNDLDLLSGRGMPTTSGKFYVVDISGRVRDEDSGEELFYLGKLAPTIEKMKRGFGMKVPRLLM